MGDPQNGLFIMENPIKNIKTDDLGVASISGNLQMISTNPRCSAHFLPQVAPSTFTIAPLRKAVVYT